VAAAPSYRDGPTMGSMRHMSEMLNLIVLSQGVVLYTMLLAMVVRARHRTSKAAFDAVLVATAILGLVWNLCAFAVYELPRIGVDAPFTWLSVIGFAGLGFLPSVVVHSVLRSERLRMRPGTQWVAGIAYGVSALAAALHLYNASQGLQVPSVLGMRILTYTFVASIVPLAGLTRGQMGRRALWAAALAAFAVSALHLSQLHRGDASWPVELLGHHASLPLALAILYQDYPFALADLFLKRALTLLTLVSIAFLAIATFGLHAASSHELVRIDPGELGILVSLWVATALAAPAICRGISWFVDSVILQRPDFGHRRTDRRASAARMRLDSRPAVRRLRAARTSHERTIGDMARSPEFRRRAVGFSHGAHRRRDSRDNVHVERRRSATESTDSDRPQSGGGTTAIRHCDSRSHWWATISVRRCRCARVHRQPGRAPN
jgi:hypothetical protein